GLHQAINYAFVSPKDLERCQVPTRAVPLENPLSEERSVLRTSLLPGLLANVSHAKRRQVPDVALFELGVVFAPSKDSVLAEESSRLTFVLAGRQRDWIGEGHTVDFYDGKGVAEMVIQPLAARVPDARLPGGDPPGYFHPRRVAELVLADRPVGMLGELHPDVADAYDLDGRVVLGEIDVEALFGAIEQLGVPQAKALPQFPASRRDMAMLVSDDHAAGTIMAALREHASGLAESVDLFDLYRGEQIPSGMKSLAFRITYRDPEATLTDKRVDEIHAQVGKAVEGLFSATLR
ncbi:MAG: hypothetical protein KC416_14360, partial [Myxococcales bacterium]|nr:hypothetical protein [Myxococcales bacterium]